MIVRSIFLILILSLAACRENSNSENSQFNSAVESTNKSNDSSTITPHQSEEIVWSKMDSLLSDPFDLASYKKKKRGALSGGNRLQSFHHKPDTVGLYYGYWLIGGRREGYIGKNKTPRVKEFNPVQLLVYKPKDKDWKMYNDLNEILIEFTAIYNDFALPELAYIGWTKDEILEEFDNPSFEKNECLVYYNNQKALVLHLAKNKVDWLKFIHLNKSIDVQMELPKMYVLEMRNR